MNIEKSNQLIAEFMEYEKIIDKADSFEFVEYNTPFEPYCSVIQLKFHKSWDWLMLVVEKIESTQPLNLEYAYSIDVNQYRNECTIDYNGYESGTIVEETGKNRLEATYKAVIAFIQWYNK